jgi:hypothetical protein
MITVFIDESGTLPDLNDKFVVICGVAVRQIKEAQNIFSRISGSLKSSKVKLTSSNSPIFDLFAGESVLSNGFGVGKSDADQNFSVFHGVDKNMSYFSGGINWDKITSPVLTVTLDTSSGATNGDVIDVTINHTLITTFVINPATGAIDIGGTN